MGALQSILMNIVTSPVVVFYCYQFRTLPLISRIKWFYVFIISLILWVLSLDKLAASPGPHYKENIWPSVLVGVVLISSLTFMRINKS